jgi:hypothetical protein
MISFRVDEATKGLESFAPSIDGLAKSAKVLSIRSIVGFLTWISASA